MLSRNAGWREVRSARQAWPTAARQTGAAVPPQVRAEPDRERSSKAQPTGRDPTAITSTEITRDAACAGRRADSHTAPCSQEDTAGLVGQMGASTRRLASPGPAAAAGLITR